MKKYLWLITFTLIIDQIVKIFVKTTMTLGESIHVLGLSWFRIHFIENEGMAFGMTFGGEKGQIILTLIRIAASVLIFLFMVSLIKKQERKLTITGVALVFAGAIGNIIDNLFYGLIFNNSSFFSVAKIFPPEGGYGSFMKGKVVDMFYFPIINTRFPSWFPFWGGQPFSFFNAIFNIADCAITIGIAILLIDQILRNKTKQTSEKAIQE